MAGCVVVVRNNTDLRYDGRHSLAFGRRYCSWCPQKEGRGYLRSPFGQFSDVKVCQIEIGYRQRGR